MARSNLMMLPGAAARHGCLSCELRSCGPQRATATYSIVHNGECRRPASGGPLDRRSSENQSHRWCQCSARPLARVVSERGARVNAEPGSRGGPIDYLDRHNVSWRVTERDARRDPGAPSEWCLVFASDSAIRRVWSYPATWRTMSDSELEALSWLPHGTLRLVDGGR